VESAHVWSRQSTQLRNVTNEITFAYHVLCRLHTCDDYTTDYSIIKCIVIPVAAKSTLSVRDCIGKEYKPVNILLRGKLYQLTFTVV
jgi:ubiquitin C-terminal hydrolase